MPHLSAVLSENVALTRSALPVEQCAVYIMGLHLAPDALDMEFRALFHDCARKNGTEESDGDSDEFSDDGFWNNRFDWGHG